MAVATTLTVAVAVADDVAVTVALYQFATGFGWGTVIFLPLFVVVFLCFAIWKSTLQ